MGNPFIDRLGEPSPAFLRKQAQEEAARQSNPVFLRAAKIAEQAKREKDIADRFAVTQQLERDKLAERVAHEKNLIAHEAAASLQRKATIDDESAFTAALVNLQGRMNVLSPEFHKAVVALGVAHPAAAHGTLGSKIIEHSNSELSKRGIDPELATAHAELNHVLQSEDVITPLQRRERLDAVREKYPHILDKSPGFREAFKEAQKRITPPPVVATPADGLVPTREVIKRPDGSVTTYGNPPKVPPTQDQKAAEKAKLVRDAVMNGRVRFGTADSTGTFSPDVGKTDWTHAEATFIDPGTGKITPKPELIPREVWNKSFDQAATAAPAATPTLALDAVSSDAPSPAAAAAPDFASPDDVKAAYKAGKLDRAAAEQTLRDKFGHE